jgi:hypothetical protein
MGVASGLIPDYPSFIAAYTDIIVTLSTIRELASMKVKLNLAIFLTQANSVSKTTTGTAYVQISPISIHCSY